MLRIGVDFHAFDGKFQGSRSHLIGLYRAMVALCPDFEFVFFLEQVDALRALPGFDRPNVRCVYMPHANPLVRLAWQLPVLRKRHRIDILHTQYIVPLWSARGNAVTIHDILFEKHPEFFTPFFVWRSRWLFRRSARKADMVLTVSEYSRREIAQCYGLPVQRIGLLLNAVDHTVFHPAQVDESAVLARRQLKATEYLLTVGRIEPRKDHATLLKAYALLGRGAPPLVIVGQRDFGYGAFEEALAALPPGSDVRVLCDVGDQELAVLLRHAKVFVYPSLAEGFGMPPLEAMASGVPVVTSTSTALPEVVGDAGLTFPPGDVAALSECLAALSRDASLRAKLVARGLERAKAFSWQDGARVLRATFLNYGKTSM
ncbi:MAG: glycosyltransferase family 4 protein [Aquabacterium sp.]|nr:glycosyltransferase family 4 protein [Aquabacterium sp.]